jgi:hypothetical protein
MKTMSKILLVCSVIIAISVSSLIADEFTLEKIIEWPEKTNQYGSPGDYIYLANASSVQVFTSDSVRILKRKLKRFQKMYSSPSGLYWGVAKRSEKSGLAPVVSEFSVYAPSGGLIYTIKNPAAMIFILSDKASNIVGVAGTEGLPETQLRFFNESGDFTSEYTISNYLGGKFCPDGTVFFAHSADSGLYVFKPDGSLIHRLQIGRYYASSRDGKLVVALTQGKIELFYQSSRTSFTAMETIEPVQILLSDDNKYTLLLTEKKAVCYSLPKLDISWEYTLDNSSEYFSSCDYSPEAGKFAVGVAIDNGPDHSFTERFTNGRVEIINLDGEISGWGQLVFVSWSKGFPRVEFSYPGTACWVIGHNDIHKVPIK